MAAGRLPASTRVGERVRRWLHESLEQATVSGMVSGAHSFLVCAKLSVRDIAAPGSSSCTVPIEYLDRHLLDCCSIELDALTDDGAKYSAF